MFGKRVSTDTIQAIIKDVRHSFYEEISAQLNDLVQKGLLTVVSEYPTIVHNGNKDKIEVRHHVKIECPAEQKIEELKALYEGRINELQNKLAKVSIELHEYKKAIALISGKRE